MKSLEILENETIANIFLDTAEEFIKDITKGLEINKETKEDIQIICNIISEFGSRVADKIQKSLFPIKKDLEVLEILRKYMSYKSYIVETYQGDREERTIEMNIEENGKLLDFRKVKQWLEENENEICN